MRNNEHCHPGFGGTTYYCVLLDFLCQKRILTKHFKLEGISSFREIVFISTIMTMTIKHLK